MAKILIKVHDADFVAMEVSEINHKRTWDAFEVYAYSYSIRGRARNQHSLATYLFLVFFTSFGVLALSQL